MMRSIVKKRRAQVTLVDIVTVVIVLIVYISGLYPILDQYVADYCTSGDPTTCMIFRLVELGIPVSAFLYLWWKAVPKREVVYYPPY
jgi:hypothetical protein